MATDPFRIQRRYDLQSLGEAVHRIAQGLNLGGVAVNQNQGNVPARYQVYPLRSYAVRLDQLPAPSDAGVGARAVITDSIYAYIPYGGPDAAGMLGIEAVGGGDEKAPVWSDGVMWRYG